MRLTLPRRVYTQSHFDWVIETFADIATRKRTLPGYRITKEAPILRAFTAQLTPMPVEVQEPPKSSAGVTGG